MAVSCAASLCFFAGATKVTPRLVQEGKTVSGFKRLFAYLVTEKLPRFACLLPARCQQKQAARRESLVLL
ncbi:TPA: hypothetical protein JS360_003112 [Escherichia coli]|nr:hypothetical protein [Escherichia coli]